MESLIQVSPEVFRVQTARFELSQLDFLKAALPHTPRARVRLCVHPDDQSRLQEMFILLGQQTYVRPHRHLGKAEGFLILEGQATLLFFSEDGHLERRVPAGPPGSGRTFYCHVREPVYHSLIIESDYLLVHETTSGPFRREDTEFAPWAPEESDSSAVAAYQRHLVANRG